MNRLSKIAANIIISLFILILVWSIISGAFYANPTDLFVPITLFVIVSIALFFSKKIDRSTISDFITKHDKKLKIILAIAIVASLAARLTFITLNYTPLDDPNMFYSEAINISSDGEIKDKKYAAIFPYIAPYQFLLAGSMNIFGDGIASVVLLNTALDILSAILLWLLVFKISKKKLTAHVAATLWMISPFNIIFSALSLPLTAVNTLLVLVLLISYIFLNSSGKYKPLPLSIALGLSLSLLNYFRPISIVIIIAIFIYIAIEALKIKSIKTGGFRMLYLVPSLVIFTVLSPLLAHTVSKVTGYESAVNSGGWSIYVGSSYEAKGQYNDLDGIHLYSTVSNSNTIQEAHNTLQKEAIQRYSELGKYELFELFTHKSMVLGSEQYKSIYNLMSYPNLYNKVKIMTFLYFICYVYMLALSLFCIYYLSAYRKSNSKNGYIFFMSLIFVGLFFAFLLVEVSSRYFTPFLVILTVIASLSITKLAKPVRPNKG